MRTLGADTGRFSKYLLLNFGALVAMFLLASCGGASTAATPTLTISPTATPTIVPTATPIIVPFPNKFEGESGQWKLTYPNGWNAANYPSSTMIHDGAIITSPDAKDSFFVTLLWGGLLVPEYASYMQSFLTSQGATEVNVASSLQSVTYGANLWSLNTATIIYKGVPSTANQYGIQRNGVPTFIETIAPTTDLTAVNKMYFQPMIATVTFRTFPASRNYK